jgi:hypothetical protein
MRRYRSVLLVVVALVVASCGSSGPGATAPSPSAAHSTPPSTSPSAPRSTSPSAPHTPSASTPHRVRDQRRGHLLCDPGLGHPNPSPTCPDPRPETAWLRSRPGEPLVLKPFRTFIDDAAGRAYARRHHLAFPFPDDYLDAPLPGSHPLHITPDTVCTGSLRVGYRDPLQDHRVTCSLLVGAATETPLPVVVWRVNGHPVQVSELFRP